MVYNYAMATIQKRFAIVCVNWNGERFLEPFFNSLINQTFSDFKIFFVDNGSIDRSLECVDRFKAHLEIEVINLDQNTGFAYANNLGIESALKESFSYIITLNNDLVLEENCLNHAIQYIDTHPQFDCFQILMLNYYDHGVIDAAGLWIKDDLSVRQVGFKMNRDDLNFESIKINGVCAGAAIYSAQSLVKIENKYGYFDQRFFAYYEDVDLSIRYLRKGYRCSLINDALVYHVHSGSSQNDSSFKTYYLIRNSLFYRYLNTTKPRLKIHFQACLFVMKELIKSLLKLRLNNLIPIIKGANAYVSLIKKYPKNKY